jgi:phosphoribosylaminoimidazole carboxylase (NCAIR synthetase)
VQLVGANDHRLNFYRTFLTHLLLSYAGVFGVELFVLSANDTGMSGVLLNEVAPRPHNTGHYTQDACAVSQFENHLRAVCGLPLGSTSMSVRTAASKFNRTA